MSSGRDEVIIHSGRARHCIKCGELNEFNVDIGKSFAPFVIECGSCGHESVIDEVAAENFRTQKYQPNVSGKLNHTWKIKKAGEDRESSAEDHEQSITVKSFPKRLSSIADLMVCLSHEVNAFNRDLDAITTAFVKDMSSHSFRFDSMMKSIDINMMASFMLSPFSSVRLKTSDPASNLHGCLVFVPEFYRVNIGVPVYRSAGFRLELIMPSMLFDNLIDKWIVELLGIAETPKLSIAGKKIIGPSIGSYWNAIPGTRVGTEHTDASPSIEIVGDGMDARVWMARHGCQPWRIQRNITEEYPAHQEIISNGDPEIRGAIQKSIMYGRVLLSGLDKECLFEKAVKIASTYSVQTVVVSDAQMNETPRSIASRHGVSVNCVSVSPELFYSNVSEIQKTKSLIVFSSDQSFIENIKKLYGYGGRLVVIAENPIADFFDGNSWCPKIYGLVGGSDHNLREAINIHSSWNSPRGVGESFAKTVREILTTEKT